jgi:hypothetical protein
LFLTDGQFLGDLSVYGSCHPCTPFCESCGDPSRGCAYEGRCIDSTSHHCRTSAVGIVLNPCDSCMVGAGPATR